MKEKPIIMTAGHVVAIMRGDMTQTRRVIKPQPTGQPFSTNGHWYLPTGDLCVAPKPMPYAVGDLLWVRERWQLHGWDFSDEVIIRYGDDTTICCTMPEFKGGVFSDGTWDDWLIEETDKLMDKYGERPADNEFGFEIAIPNDMPMRSPIFMPEWASRLKLEVTGVKAEKLHAISLADAKAEGCRNQAHFGNVWDGINAKRGYGMSDGSWWVFAYTFRMAPDG